MEHAITGAQIGATDNYKKTRPVHRCPNVYCKDRRPKPPTVEECPSCGEPLKTTNVAYSPNDLRTTLANHIVGAKLKSGRTVWFDEPVPRRIEPKED